MRFTDHDAPMTIGGEVFTPAGGFATSAFRKQAGLGTEDSEAFGVLTSAAITDDDLRAGKYREAEVLVQVIDHEYPWAGFFHTTRAWIVETAWSGEHWEFKLEGITRWLEPPVGDTYNRPCPYDLGDGKCKFNLAGAGFTETVSVISITDRSNFVVGPLAQASGFFTFGEIEFTSGPNDGEIAEIKLHTLSAPDGEVELHLELPNDLGVGNTAIIRAGCDKLATTCKDKFSNLVNFGGHPFIPGPDKVIRTPNAKKRS